MKKENVYEIKDACILVSGCQKFWFSSKKEIGKNFPKLRFMVVYFYYLITT